MTREREQAARELENEAAEEIAALGKSSPKPRQNIRGTVVERNTENEAVIATCPFCERIGRCVEKKAVDAYKKGHGLLFDCKGCGQALQMHKGPSRRARRRAESPRWRRRFGKR